jgi:hypothetical protein
MAHSQGLLPSGELQTKVRYNQETTVGEVLNFDIENHRKLFPHSAVQIVENRLYGCWMVGNMYKAVNGYYGEYPPKFLDRVKSLFPGRHRILHLFSGSVKTDGIWEMSFDLNPTLGADTCGNAADLAAFWPRDWFDIIMADPPYSPEHAERYGFKMPNIPEVIRQCHKVLRPGGMLVWLSTRAPIYRARPKYPDRFSFKGLVMLQSGSNRLFRGVTFLEKI